VHFQSASLTGAALRPLRSYTGVRLRKSNEVDRPGGKA
jgi:hypothetical protein